MRDIGLPLVSVIIPSRDRQTRLPRALRSALNQTYERIEVVVVDDGSELPVDVIVERVAHGDPRVSVIRLAQTRGAAAARNVALSRAEGEVIAFLDDDDWWDPLKIERQVERFAEDPTIGIVSADYYVVDERAGRSGARPCRFRGPGTIGAHHLLWFNLPGSFLTGILRRDSVGGELWLDESFPSVEDWDLWVRCSSHTKVAVLAEPLGFQSIHESGRLSDPTSNRPGLQAFEHRHGARMSRECRGYHRAHQEMESGEGWSKRARVAQSILRAGADAPARTAAILLTEQWAALLGRITRDPGLPLRVLADSVRADVREDVAVG